MNRCSRSGARSRRRPRAGAHGVAAGCTWFGTDRFGAAAPGRSGRPWRCASAEAARTLRRTDAALRQRGGVGVAHDDLAGVGCSLHRGGRARRRSGDDQFLVGVADPEQVDSPGGYRSTSAAHPADGRRHLSRLRSAARISTAALHACRTWSSPRKSRSSASPPNFSRLPPRSWRVRASTRRRGSAPR